MLKNILPENRYLFISLINQFYTVKITKKSAIFLIQCASVFDFIFSSFNFIIKEHNDQLRQLKNTILISTSLIFERDYFSIQLSPNSG